MAGRHIYEPFDIFEASQAQSFLQDQTVMRFATLADRSTALPAPEEGMMTYVVEVGTPEFYDGADWKQIQPTRQIQAARVDAGQEVPFNVVHPITLAEPVTIGTSGTDWFSPNGLTPPHRGMVTAFFTCGYTEGRDKSRRFLEIRQGGNNFCRTDLRTDSLGTVISITGTVERANVGETIQPALFFDETLFDDPDPPPEPFALPPVLNGGFLYVEMISIAP